MDELAALLARYGVSAVFVNVLLIYFPFSKLTHAIGAFATNLIRSGE